MIITSMKLIIIGGTGYLQIYSRGTTTIQGSFPSLVHQVNWFPPTVKNMQLPRVNPSTNAKVIALWSTWLK